MIGLRLGIMVSSMGRGEVWVGGGLNCMGRRGVYECEEFFFKGFMMFRRVWIVVY